MFGIITGYICLFCFCILLAKALTRKLGIQKADRLFMKLHKPASGILLIACTVHMILVYPILKMRNPAVIVTGICAVVTYLLLIIFCHNSGFRILSKNLKKNHPLSCAFPLSETSSVCIRKDTSQAMLSKRSEPPVQLMPGY